MENQKAGRIMVLFEERNILLLCNLCIRTSKDRQSMTQTTQEMNDALSFAKKFDLKSTNDDHDEAGDHLAKLTVILSSNIYIEKDP